MLDLNELLQKIPQIIGRITKFQAFAVYLLDRQGEELTIAYSVGYPDDVARTLRVKVGHGLVGAAVAGAQPILVNDVRTDPRYVEAVPGSQAELVVPLRRKGRVLGALNLLSDTVGQFTDRGTKGSFRITVVSGSSVYLKNGANKAVFNLTSDTFTG